MDYQGYLKSDHWKKMKAWFRKSGFPKRCLACGVQTKLQLHHKSYDNLGKEIYGWDLILLCKSCHERVHVYEKQERVLLERATDEVIEKVRSGF
jgi:5-methylcytosine-specific restriction endonuclease McrA